MNLWKLLNNWKHLKRSENNEVKQQFGKPIQNILPFIFSIGMFVPFKEHHSAGKVKKMLLKAVDSSHGFAGHVQQKHIILLIEVTAYCRNSTCSLVHVDA